jgi:hypothetical protein
MGINQTTRLGIEKYLMMRVNTHRNKEAENILNTIFEAAIGNNKNGASTIDVNGGKGV